MVNTELLENNPVSGDSQVSELCKGHSHPSVTFENIIFSDGTAIHLEPDDVVVLVGPNNAGKSVALRELEAYFGTVGERIVTSSAQLRRNGTAEGFREFVTPHIQIRPQGNSLSISGYNFSTSAQRVEDFWPDQINVFSSLFCVRIMTEQRIFDSNSVNSFDPVNEMASHPMHTLYLDDKIEDRIGGYFRRAFGKDLILYRTGGNRLPLLVGEKIKPAPGEDRVSSTYSKRLINSTLQLENQGDGMRSFASVILHLLAPTTPSVLLLDEPEAFLHPPQASGSTLLK